MREDGAIETGAPRIPSLVARATELIAEAILKWPALESVENLDGMVQAALDPEEDLTSLRCDIVLATALAAGSRPAQSVFERELMPPLEQALVRGGIRPELADDALQVVRFRLLVSTDSKPARIASYRGRSSLGRWLYVVATREARAMRGRASREPISDVELAHRAAVESGDLETEFLAREHRAVFSRSLAAAVHLLTSKERLLLRLDVLEGLTDGEIAKIYDVHRTTVLRWLERATRKLIAETKKQLQRELSLRSSELESLLRELVSHLDLSLGRLLAETPVPSSAADR